MINNFETHAFKSSMFETSYLSKSIFLALSTFASLNFAYAEDTQSSKTDIDVAQLEKVVVVGSRSGVRTVTESPSPIDVISGEQLLKQGNSIALRDVLAKIIPSFKVDTVRSRGYSSVSRPAGLRGLGGGYTLVLVNGKRRHVGAHQSENGVLVEGFQAADLDLIPISSIARVEVLRDGAAAQYGSDAVSGVINIVLKSADHGGSLSATYGGRANFAEDVKDNGETFQTNGNIGLPLGQDGFAHLAFDYKKSDNTKRSAPATGNFYPTVNGQADPREQTVNKRTFGGGLPGIENLNLSYNAELPIAGGKANLYSFSTASWRDAISGLAFRRPTQNSIITELYPDGTTPDFLIDETDYQSVIGIKGDDFLGWSWDVSTSYGQDKLEYSTNKNLNPSLGPASPTSFGLQKYTASQWTSNIDFNKAFDIGFGASPLNVAWGLDYRKEEWRSKATDPLAYTNGGYIYPASSHLAGQAATIGSVGTSLVLPEDESDISRSNTAAYLDLGLDIINDWYVGVAGRFEHYDDSAGDTFNGKLTSRYAFNPQVAIRGTVSSGFVAPSLVQQGMATTGIGRRTFNGVVLDSYNKHVSTDSAIGKALGAKPLTPTESTNYTVGFTLTPSKNLNIAIDAYRIDLKDRISQTSSLTGTGVDAILQANGFPHVQAVQYFANLFDSKTTGIDIVAEYTQTLNQLGRIRWNLGFNWNDTDITRLADNPTELNSINVNRFERLAQGAVLAATPKTTLSLGANWQYKNLDLNTRITRHDDVTWWGNTEASDEHFGAKWIVDLDATYSFTDQLSFTLGADNLFNTYPDKHTVIDTSGASNYSRISPFGMYGGFYYGRINYRF